MLQDFIYSNYATCLIILFMIVFLVTNTTFDKKETTLFMRAILLALVLVVVDTVESYTASFAYPTTLRVLMSAIGYTVRPLCIMCILVIVVRERVVKFYLLLLPALINAVISFSALVCDVAFSYDAANEFVRGPLGWTPFVVSGLYLFVLILCSIKYFREKNYYEALIVFAIVVAAICAVVLEMIYGKDGLINGTIVISVTFYYLFFHTQTFKRDHLTKALNRRSFYMDAEKNEDSITALIGIDLNNLKVINDTKGHEAGDIALKTLTECVDKVLMKGCYLYRVGGDEFFVLCNRKTKEQVEKIVRGIKEEMSKTEYSCAVGIAMKTVDKTFNAMCIEADRAMYEDKSVMKMNT
ncbi:MAG: GGDEF domain-containing protein [Lachnospiraceae bacterium]|nr:GGDEF domain-containing protein [Lachnospiraceae bacterium]